MTRPPLRLLILALAVAAAPLIFTLPAWVILWLTICWGYGLLADRRGWAVLPRWVRLAAFALGMLIIIANAGLRFEGTDFISLLAVMAGLKPLEVRKYRDSMITIFLAFFLTITSLFVLENLLMTGYLFISVWFTTAVLIRVNHPHGNISPQIRLAARFILMAIPLTILLFVLFPRLTNGLWGMPWQQRGYSGFARSISIGGVARIALNDDPAFAASFAGMMPEANQLYWRGLVFRYFDGHTWHPVHRVDNRPFNPRGEQTIAYTVIMEPTGLSNLFVLDLPLHSTAMAVIKEDHTLVARWTVSQRLRYQAVSVLDYQETLAREVDRRWLQLPEGFNPRALALGKSWRDARLSPEDIIKAALAYFREQNFVYSLQPGQVGRHVVDDFLFSTRNGFCEHYATAFTVLMRAAGLPARMVGGYQGGTWNSMGDFLAVRQSDAHVWCEVWLADQGWVRIDPTAVVAPERVVRGGLSASTEAAQGDDQVFLPLRLLKNFHETWEAINTRWNMWFMSFSAEDQLAIFTRLGLSLGRQSQWLLLLVLPLAFVVISALGSRLWQMHASGRTEDVNLKIYKRFLAKMNAIGMAKPPGQGPLAYAEEVGNKLPMLKESANSITSIYIALRYGPAPHDADIGEMNAKVRNFNPKKLLEQSGSTEQ